MSSGEHQPLGEDIEEKGAVGQVGEGVVVGHEHQALLGLLTLADVEIDADIVSGLPLEVAHRGEVCLHPVDLAALPAVDELPGPRLPLVEAGPHFGIDLWRGQAGAEDFRRPADHLLCRVSRFPGKMGVDVLDHCIDIGDDHRGRALLDGGHQHLENTLGVVDLGEARLQLAVHFPPLAPLPHQFDMQPHPGAHHRGVEGLMDEINRPAGQCLALVAGIALGGDEDHRDFLGAGCASQSLEDLVTIHLRHHDVEEDEIGLLRRGHGQGFPARGGGEEGELALERLVEELEVLGDVVDDEYTALVHQLPPL